MHERIFESRTSYIFRQWSSLSRIIHSFIRLLQSLVVIFFVVVLFCGIYLSLLAIYAVKRLLRSFWIFTFPNTMIRKRYVFWHWGSRFFEMSIKCLKKKFLGTKELFWMSNMRSFSQNLSIGQVMVRKSWDYCCNSFYWVCSASAGWPVSQ